MAVGNTGISAWFGLFSGLQKLSRLAARPGAASKERDLHPWTHPFGSWPWRPAPSSRRVLHSGSPGPQAQGRATSFIGPLTANASVWPNPGWWKAFGSDEMSGLIVTAQTDNLDIAVAMANVLQAEANRDIALAALFPDITANASAQRSRTPGSTSLVPNGKGGFTKVSSPHSPGIRLALG